MAVFAVTAKMHTTATPYYSQNLLDGFVVKFSDAKFAVSSYRLALSQKARYLKEILRSENLLVIMGLQIPGDCFYAGTVLPCYTFCEYVDL